MENPYIGPNGNNIYSEEELEKLADSIIATYDEKTSIGPNGNDIYFEEELNAAYEVEEALNATYEAIRRAELERELESFYSLPLNMRQSIMRQYKPDYIKSLGIDNLSPKSGINHK